MPGGIRITLEGDDRLIEKLMRMGETGQRLAHEALQDSVDHVRNRAVEGIANGPKTGRVYDTYFWTRGVGPDRVLHRGRKRPKPHQASARGEYPAADTGNLMRTIWGEVEDSMAQIADRVGAAALNWADWGEAEAQLRGSVGAHASYAVHLEYKSPYDGGRPFLRRALAESEDFIRERFMALRGRIVE